MNTLFLSGYGISLTVDGGKLHIRDGRNTGREEPRTIVYRPKMVDVDNIVIYGHSGNISLDAIRWLSKQNVQLTVLNWDGRLLTSIMIPEIRQNNVRLAQYDASRDERKVEIAKSLIDAKIKNSKHVLNWLTQRYPELREEKKELFAQIDEFESRLAKAKTTKEVRSFEGNVANAYWEIVSSTFDEKFEFEGRVVGKTGRPYGAVDPINALFNYGYIILESQCWRAANARGLDPYIGFNHEPAANKASLIYDLQEPFRWMIDVAVIKALENKVFDKSDFIKTENYNIRLRSVGVEKLIKEVNAQFTSKVDFKGKSWEWGYVISQKVGEFTEYLLEKKKTVDWSDPVPNIGRFDNAELREMILNTTCAEWVAMGNNKSTLYYLKKGAKGQKSFKIYEPIRKKLVITFHG